jgi:glycosyltransferase involved in cell wall biosynthesis
MKKRFAIVTVCKSRLHHLKQSLPNMISQGADEVIVVDYDCPQGTAEWVEAHHQGVKVVRATDPLGFCLSRARNIGTAAAKAKWICIVDADGLLRPGWLAWLDANLSDESYSFIGDQSRQPESAGVLVARRSDILLAGGYDEAIRGWGPDDLDLRSRLRALGLRWVGFPNELIGVISNGDEIRDRGAALSHRNMKFRAKLYLRAKDGVSAQYGHLDLCCRTALMAQITDWVSANATADEAALYLFRFARYCPACAARLATNYQLVLSRSSGMLGAPRRTVVKRPFNPHHQFR